MGQGFGSGDGYGHGGLTEVGGDGCGGFGWVWRLGFAKPGGLKLGSWEF